MKKVSAFMITLILMFSLAACSSNGSNGEKDSSGGKEGVTELTFWAPFSGGDGDFIKALVDDFNKENKDVKVTVLNLKAEEYYTKMRTAVVSKQAPDVAIAHTTKLAELIDSKQIVDIQAAAEKAGLKWDTYSQNILDSTIIDGKHYAVPLDTHALIMFANTDLLEKAGLLENGAPKLGTGEDEFISFLKEVKGKSPKGTFPLSATSSGDSPLRIWWTLYSQQGGKLLSEDGKEAVFNNEQGLKALEYVGELMEEDLWPRNIRNGGEVFTAKTAAIHFNGVWMTGALEQNKDLKFTAIPFPQIFGDQATWGDSHTFVLPNKDGQTEAKKEASLKFADWVAEHSASWAKAGHVPAKTSVVESQEFKDLPYRSNYAEIADYVSYMPNSPKITAINDVIKKHLNNFMTGQVDAKATLKNAEEEVNALLK
ncbi:ABC transporter substrate-binding protein [Bacillus sp. EB01]|uniref:ABC transporter substrate-binding protein n=1 Tax=Bacillus sp. EB01 TaxID=1347086 RepID=UPI0005C5C6EB|nr:ABC transporter substrate-binding protein [Bacillus sp. EB01]